MGLLSTAKLSTLKTMETPVAPIRAAVAAAVATPLGPAALLVPVEQRVRQAQLAGEAMAGQAKQAAMVAAAVAVRVSELPKASPLLRERCYQFPYLRAGTVVAAACQAALGAEATVSAVVAPYRGHEESQCNT